MIESLTKILNNIPSELAGVMMAMFLSILRIIYDDKEARPVRVVIEAMICGALSLTAISAITAMGLNENWAVFIGGSIGYLGPTTVRGFALKALEKRVK